MPNTEWWGDPRGLGGMEPAAHVLLLLDVGPGRGAQHQRVVHGGRAAVPAHLLAIDASALPYQVHVFECDCECNCCFKIIFT